LVLRWDGGEAPAQWVSSYLHNFLAWRQQQIQFLKCYFLIFLLRVTHIETKSRYPVILRVIQKKPWELIFIHIISYHVISYHIISYHIISYIMSRHVMSCHIISYHIMYHIIYTISYIILHHVSDHMSSYISYHIIYHVISCIQCQHLLLCFGVWCSKILSESPLLETVFFFHHRK